MSVTRHAHPSSERGAILPLVALLVLVIFGFAALAVDATAAYAERRQAQSTADAAVLAAALEYLSNDSPTGQDIYDIVKQYATANWGPKAPSDTEWANCNDPNRPTDYAPILDTTASPAVPFSDCISLKQVDGEPALLRVRLPDYDMPTAFATIIGFDTVAVSATATAELRYNVTTKILPFSIPANPAQEECLATPPSGLLPSDPGPCSGPVQGNFGLLDSPWFGAGAPHFTQPQACPSDPNFNTRAPHNIAVGLDHVITTWPSPPAAPSIGTSVPNNHPGADDCSSAQAGVVPYVLLTQPGNTNTASGKALLQQGFIADDASPTTAAGLPGRLRQPSEVPASKISNATPDRLPVNTNAWNFDIDNIGLWEYLSDDVANSHPCHSSQFTGLEGRELTLQLYNPDPPVNSCLETDPPEELFVDDIADSPRFAVVPMLNYNSGSQYGNKWWAVLELRPVFLQSTWYECKTGSDKECLFLPDDQENDPGFDPTVRDNYSVLFNPGEGDDAPCYLNNSGTCVAPTTNKFQMMGLSALILDWDDFPSTLENQFGANQPLEVFLHPNE